MAIRNESRIATQLLHLALVIGLVVTALPLVWTVSSSLKPVADIFTYPPRLLPQHATLQNYQRLFAGQPFGRWLFTSIWVAFVTTVISVFLSALAGFGFAKYRFRGRRILFDVMFSSLLVPFAVVLAPLFVEVARLGWADSYIALILPWVAPAFGVFMMRQFIVQTIPDELLDAARIDGAGEFTLFLRIVLPLLRPAIGALTVWTFLNAYNSFLWPLTVLSSVDKFTLPLGLNAIYGNFNREYGLVMAGSFLAAAPSIVMFLALRKQLIAGLTLGAVKG